MICSSDKGKMKSEKLPSYGGQALIEGVLMRGSRYVAAAMRNPDGEIVTQVEELTGIYKSGIKNIPFVRGLILLWDSLGLGMRYLTVSANLQTGEDEKIEGPTLYLTIGTSVIIAALLFFAAPAALGQLMEKWFHISNWTSNVLEGLIRLVIVIGYIWAVGRMAEIRRVFQYHGAEHKTINAFEAGAELTPSIVKQYSLEHPRCGTSFLLTLVLLSIIVFALLGPMPAFWRITSRILLLPPLAGIAYEYIRWTARHLDYAWVRGLIRPNLALQKLTTAEPDESMLEVAIASFNSMYACETAPATVEASKQSNA
jgi:uncharacterized protein YqhQ